VYYLLVLVLVCACRISRAIFISRFQHRLIVFFSSTFFSFGAVVVVAIASVLPDELRTKIGVFAELAGRVCVCITGAFANASRDDTAMHSDETNGNAISETMAK
jgi:hypothetical protein